MASPTPRPGRCTHSSPECIAHATASQVPTQRGPAELVASARHGLAGHVRVMITGHWRVSYLVVVVAADLQGLKAYAC
jgi:hypothetical protein